MKDVSGQVGMKRFPTLAPVNGTAAAILIAAAPAQFYLIAVQQRRQPDGSFDGCKIRPTRHRFLRSLGVVLWLPFRLHTNRPDKAEQFPTHGGDDLVFVLAAGRESFVARVQSPLRFPGDVFDSLVRIGVGRSIVTKQVMRKHCSWRRG
ncbi:MAG: hypothetical protein ABSH05_15550 [Bryobacteraceae bacterium]|jgi:hypothetical protein